MELKNGNGLNSWFNTILWLNIAFSGGGLIMNLMNLMKGDNGFDFYVIGSTCAVCIAIAGLYWLLKAEKVVFYLFVAGCLINTVFAFVQYRILALMTTELCILSQEVWLSRVCGQVSARLFSSCF